MPDWMTEPATLITDYVLGALALWWGVRLRVIEPPNATRMWWSRGFLALAVAALLGGTVHGFRTLLGPDATALMWWASLVAAGGFGYAALATAGTAHAARTGARWTRVVPVVAAVALVAYAALVWRDPAFRYAALASAVGLIALATQQAAAWMAVRVSSAPWIVSGVAVAAIGATIQQRGWAPTPAFNHNDLFHLVQVGSTYLLYRGGRLLSPGSEPV